MWQSCILRPLYAVPWFPLVTLFVLSVSHLISALCLFYKFAWPFSLISFNLKVIHCAPSSSVMAHVLTLHSDKLDMFSFFYCACSFFNAWVVMHSDKCPCIPKLVVRCCSFHFCKHSFMLNFISFSAHIFGFIFTVHESLICPCSSHHRPPIPQH